MQKGTGWARLLRKLGQTFAFISGVVSLVRAAHYLPQRAFLKVDSVAQKPRNTSSRRCCQTRLSRCFRQFSLFPVEGALGESGSHYDR
jgi:hypothetical protein